MPPGNAFRHRNNAAADSSAFFYSMLNRYSGDNELYNKGFDVCGKKLGFTQTHQIVIDVSKIGGGDLRSNRLEKNNIIVNKNLLPSDEINSKTLQNPSGLRISTHALTRLGMKKSDMKYIAELFREVLLKNKDVKKEVIEFRKNFQEIKYCEK